VPSLLLIDQFILLRDAARRAQGVEERGVEGESVLPPPGEGSGEGRVADYTAQRQTKSAVGGVATEYFRKT